jgi:hypothetical protein
MDVEGKIRNIYIVREFAARPMLTARKPCTNPCRFVTVPTTSWS